MINWDGQNTMSHVDKVLGEINNNNVRLNHGKCDKNGRLFVGTMLNEDNNNGNAFNMSKKNGGLYNFNNQQGLKELKNKVGLSNGIAWNNNQNKMFYVDSYDLNVKQFDYDQNTGNISKCNIQFA